MTAKVEIIRTRGKQDAIRNHDWIHRRVCKCPVHRNTLTIDLYTVKLYTSVSEQKIAACHVPGA